MLNISNHDARVECVLGLQADAVSAVDSLAALAKARDFGRVDPEVDLAILDLGDPGRDGIRLAQVVDGPVGRVAAVVGIVRGLLMWSGGERIVHEGALVNLRL